MRNTRSNLFLQSMKTNPLSVKKLKKKLILRALRQLHAVSEISFLIQWVTPPPKVENLQFEFFLSFWNSTVVQILQLCIVFTLSDCVLHWLYIFAFLVLYNTHLLLFLQVAFSAKWMWSDPFPSMLNSTQPVHKFFMCVLFEICSNSSLCPCQLKKLRTTLIYSPTIWNFRLFAAQTVTHSTV